MRILSGAAFLLPDVAVLIYIFLPPIASGFCISVTPSERLCVSFVSLSIYEFVGLHLCVYAAFCERLWM